MSAEKPHPHDQDCFTIIGRFDDSGEATVTVIERDAVNQDPHWVALKHTGDLSESGEFEVVALLRGRCEVLVTQQSLRLFSDRLLAE
jgi:hypothetical protein